MDWPHRQRAGGTIDERVLDAYNALTTPLPVIEDGDVELYCEP